MTILYDDPNISCEVVCAALQNAASLGHLRIVDFLMYKPEIAQSVKHVALVFAVRSNAEQLFNFWSRSKTDSSNDEQPQLEILKLGLLKKNVEGRMDHAELKLP